MKHLASSAALALVLSAAGAVAQQGLGEAEYMTACAVCHGESGRGGGPFAEVLSIAVPGLTGLAAANGGVFPVMQTLRVIDGRVPIAGHGGPMPVWGDRYVAAAKALAGPFDAEMIARGRLLSLIYYLEDIQD
jgi:mono/diheme cytochrome c family protein